jgi:hypothetical protein
VKCPGGKNKKWNECSEEFYQFLERQQDVMRTREILAGRPFGEYGRPDKVVREKKTEVPESDHDD